MSTDPTPMPEPQPETDAAPTEIAARGRADPWADDEAAATAELDLPTARAQRQFDPRSIARLRNLMDEENAYCS